LLQATKHLDVGSTRTDKFSNRKKGKERSHHRNRNRHPGDPGNERRSSTHGIIIIRQLRQSGTKGDGGLGQRNQDATINGLETIKQQFELTEKRHFTMLQALHEVQATIKQGEKSPGYYHLVNLAISSAKRQVTNTEDIIKAAAKGNANIALLDNKNLTAVWDNMSSYAATMGLTPIILD
jgi:hypothetical protein